MEVNVPKPFNPSKNEVAKDWQIWKKEFLTYLKLSNGYQTLSEGKRAYLLQNLMGKKAFEAMENINFDNPEDKNDMDILLAKFDEIFDPPSNIVEDRYKFFSRMKRENEAIEKYVMELKEKAKKCQFGDQTEKFIIDMIIRNMDNYLRQMTFKEKEIDLDGIIESYKQYAINTKKIKEVSENIAKDFNSERKAKSDNTNHNPSGSKDKPKGCWKCNTRHRPNFCPAFGKVCNVCNERNHFNGLCKKKFNDNKEEQPNRTCLKCGKTHPYGECPAYYNVCQKCKQKGHYVSQCDKLNAMKNLNTATNYQGNESSSFELPKVPPPSYTQATAGSTNNAQTNPKHNPYLDNCYHTDTLRTRVNVNPNATGYCHSCNNNPNAFCLDCKHRKVNPEHLKRQKEGFVEVKHSDVPKRAQCQPRPPPIIIHNENKRYPPPKNAKKKDDSCCIS